MSKAILVLTFDDEQVQPVELWEQLVKGSLPPSVTGWMAIKEPAAYVLQAVDEASRGEFPPAVPDPVDEAARRAREYDDPPRPMSAAEESDFDDPAGR